MITSFNNITTIINANNEKVDLVLNLHKNNVSRITDENNPKLLTDSDETKNLVNSLNENGSNKNQDTNIKIGEELNAKKMKV